MKAIKIDVLKKEVYAVEITRNIDTIYKHLGCDCFCQAGRPMRNGDCLLVDDNGLLKDAIGAFKIGQYPNALSGHGILIGINSIGDTVDVKTDIETLRQMITFVDVKTLPKPGFEIYTP